VKISDLPVIVERVFQAGKLFFHLRLWLEKKKNRDEKKRKAVNETSQH
jgi:hypothetical protein